MRPGFRLELPNGDVFETRTEVVSQIQQEPQYFFNGGRDLTALYSEATGSSQSGAVYAGSGAQIQTFELQFYQHEDSQEEWGDAAPSDNMVTKRDVFNEALAATRITSDNPALLEVGEYATTGRYGPRTVVLLNSELTVNPREESSRMEGSLTFGDAADLSDIETAVGMPG